MVFESSFEMFLFLASYEGYYQGTKYPFPPLKYVSFAYQPIPCIPRAKVFFLLSHAVSCSFIYATLSTSIGSVRLQGPVPAADKRFF